MTLPFQPHTDHHLSYFHRATPVDQYQFKLTDSTAPMDPAASHPSSGLPAGLPAQGLNSQALNSSIGDQTLTSLTTTGLNNTSLSSTIDNNHHTTSANNPAPLNHLPTTGNQAPKRSLVFDDDDGDDVDGLRGMMDEHTENNYPEPTGALKFTDDAMAQYATMDLESLRAAANHYAVRRRMSQDMKDELDELYYDFECSVVRLAIRNRIRPHLFSHYLGHSHRINGASSWNNFQKYDPEARKIYDALDCDEARIQVGALGDTKSDDEKKQYRDPTFLNTLRPMERDDVLDSLPNPQSNGPVQASRITYEKTAKMVADWVHKVKIDMASMAFYHQVEGYFVLASLHPKGPLYKKGGSSFGNRYLRMIGEQNGSDASAEFRIWVAAQLIQINNGCQPTEIKRQRTKSVGDVTDQFLANRVSDNVHEIRVKLRELIREGSGGKYSCPWPGKDCKNKLKQMKLSLEIDDNHWNLIPSDMMVPPENVIKNPDNRPHSSKRKRPSFSNQTDEEGQREGAANGSSSAANSNPSAANGDASATSSSTSAANGSTSAANGSTSAANSSTSAANSSTSAANSSTSAANGDASAANGNASAANGNASAANGNASAANGNASAANGNDGNASAANGSASAANSNASVANGNSSSSTRPEKGHVPSVLDVT
ncbi:hypothetical protein Pst134EA_028976 [Puccinia striiformis f. sp. tritici]|uniref:hypothetical protein n=1 Tax=Puccinia striiformis f. sp. tritici TaxID=168172 RepID=UPI0020084EB9|nr:hypothetical protein Pst134EA_028976 [Puccinia striiformis f. sp. tritici]KAH9446992.1 hypothetical protein Pst134EA_028976 [Puccinia striiformis f. sp. tritici]